MIIFFRIKMLFEHGNWEPCSECWTWRWLRCSKCCNTNTYEIGCLRICLNWLLVSHSYLSYLQWFANSEPIYSKCWSWWGQWWKRNCQLTLIDRKRLIVNGNVFSAVRYHSHNYRLLRWFPTTIFFDLLLISNRITCPEGMAMSWALAWGWVLERQALKNMKLAQLNYISSWKSECLEKLRKRNQNPITSSLVPWSFKSH